jgi:dTDP-4-dehydrorhamnose 3,5-epimerase
MSKPDISSKFTEQLSRQAYGESKAIDGVKFLEFKFFSDDGGDFHEIPRMANGRASFLEGFEIRQVNRSRFNPGLVKAFHLHLLQDEVWAVHPLDRLLVGLVDVRKGSKTEGVSMRFVLGGGKSRFLYIPRGVAHGGTALGTTPADVVYLMNQQFSSDNPDEWRLPWDALGSEFWEISKG